MLVKPFFRDGGAFGMSAIDYQIHYFLNDDWRMSDVVNYSNDGGSYQTIYIDCDENVLSFHWMKNGHDDDDVLKRSACGGWKLKTSYRDGDFDDAVECWSKLIHDLILILTETLLCCMRYCPLMMKKMHRTNDREVHSFEIHWNATDE